MIFYLHSIWLLWLCHVVLLLEMILIRYQVHPQTADVTAMEQVSGENAEKKISGISEKVITCPLVGTFYSSPAPDAEDYVKVGDTVKKGQVIGIVEAMKLMNEIESEYDGIVEEILVKNEETVEYGQPLFRIR